jgi:hypothetical protein
LNTIPEFEKLYHFCESVKINEFLSTIFHLRGNEMSLISMILMLATQIPRTSLELLSLFGIAVSRFAVVFISSHNFDSFINYIPFHRIALLQTIILHSPPEFIQSCPSRSFLLPFNSRFRRHPEAIDSLPTLSHLISEVDPAIGPDSLLLLTALIKNAAGLSGTIVRRSRSLLCNLVKVRIVDVMVDIVRRGDEMGGRVCFHLSLFCQ